MENIVRLVSDTKRRRTLDYWKYKSKTQGKWQVEFGDDLHRSENIIEAIDVDETIEEERCGGSREVCYCISSTNGRVF